MLKSSKLAFMPSKLKGKFLVGFCLMSLIPNLVGVYIGSLFIQYPIFGSPSFLLAISGALLFSLTLSLMGFQLIKQILYPIVSVGSAAKEMAQGNWGGRVEGRGSDELGELSQSLRVISTNARELLEKVERLSGKDKLTGLYNASYIHERLDEEIQRSAYLQRPCSFAYFNINHFGAYAMKYGQPASEGVLKIVAGILSKYLSPFDRAAHITKDEFAVIFPDKNKKKVIEIVERISKEIATYPMANPGIVGTLFFTVCTGISEDPLDGTSADQLYSKAANRLKLAKEKGDNLIEAFA